MPTTEKHQAGKVDGATRPDPNAEAREPGRGTPGRSAESVTVGKWLAELVPDGPGAPLWVKVSSRGRFLALTARAELATAWDTKAECDAWIAANAPGAYVATEHLWVEALPR